MESILSLCVLTLLIVASNGFMHSGKNKHMNTTDHHVLATVKIYSNLAEVIQPLGRLPLEFSEDDWKDIRADSVTLVGTTVNITQQTITEQKKSLNNAQVYVRSPSSSNTETKFIRATLIDEKRNLVKLIDKDISKEPIFFTASSDHIVYDNEPPQSKYYINFTYDTSDAVYVSYLRSNLSWRTHYQLNLFDEPKGAVLIALADIRNGGQSKVEIEHAELVRGDINLHMHQQSRTYTRDEENAGVYIFGINQPFSIDAKTNYLLPMFHPRVTVERYASISNSFQVNRSFTGKAQRSYRLQSDRFLSKGNCIMREYDRLVGETSLPDLAAKNKYEFSMDEDADIIYKENVTLISTHIYNTTTRYYGTMRSLQRATYNVTLLLNNYKKNRSVQIEYERHVYGTSVKLIQSNMDFTQEGSTIKYKTILAANDRKTLFYGVEITSNHL